MNVSSLLQAGGVLTVPLPKATNPQARGPLWAGSVLPSCLQPWGCRRGIGPAVGGEGSRLWGIKVYTLWVLSRSIGFRRGRARVVSRARRGSSACVGRTRWQAAGKKQQVLQTSKQRPPCITSHAPHYTHTLEGSRPAMPTSRREGRTAGSRPGTHLLPILSSRTVK